MDTSSINRDQAANRENLPHGSSKPVDILLENLDIVAVENDVDLAASFISVLYAVRA